MPTWPESLELRLGISGFTESGVASFIESEVDQGPSFRRLISPKPTPIKGQQSNYTDADIETFIAFYKDDLLGGLLEFEWANPRTQEAATLRFAKQSPYSISAPAGMLRRISFNLELMP